MSIDEFASTTPVSPPIANRQAALYVSCDTYMVASHLKILIPVGTLPEDPNTFYCCGRRKYTTQAFLLNTRYFYIVDSDM